MGDTIAAATGSESVMYTDSKGVRHSLQPLLFGDLVEVEELFGAMSDWPKTGALRAKLWLHCIWRAMRREGRTRHEVRQGKYSCTLDEAAETIVLGSGTHTTRDNEGVERTFQPLTLGDLVEIEETFGPFINWFEKPWPAKMVVTYLWVSLRRHGLTKEQIDKKQWSITVDDIKDLFDTRVNRDKGIEAVLNSERVNDVVNLWVKIMGVSGIAINKEAGKDQSPLEAGEALPPGPAS